MPKVTAVLGMGESGIAAAAWLNACGQPFHCYDSRAQIGDGSFPLTLGVDLNRPQDFLDKQAVSRIVVSPGLSPQQLAALTDYAQTHGIAVQGELDLFAEALARLREERGYQPRCLAITGTNGKTTTTRLTATLLRSAGISAVAAGNISPALLTALLLHLEEDSLPAVWVLELSSFQLYWSTPLALAGATILNLTEDHCDWHGDMAAYRAAKLKILARSQMVVVNQEEQDLRKACQSLPTISFGFHRDDRLKLACDDGALWYRDANGWQHLLGIDELPFKGWHNHVNALTALGLGMALGLKPQQLLAGFKDFRLDPHRMVEITCHHGVRFIDDSKATNVGATLAALRAMREDPTVKRCLLILGGDGKGQDFSPLATIANSKVSHVALVGRDAPLFAALFANTPIKTLDCGHLEAAVPALTALTSPGDVVLLSPACASLDQFQNYAVRGQTFARLVATATGDAAAAALDPEKGGGL